MSTATDLRAEDKVSIISSNWRGEPLRNYETLTKLIANTATAKGLTVRCRFDRGKHPTGYRVAEEEVRQIGLREGGIEMLPLFTTPSSAIRLKHEREVVADALYPAGLPPAGWDASKQGAPARHERLAPFCAVLVSLSIGHP